MSNIKYYVIIPTKERADVLKYALDSVLSNEYDNLHVIVSDNNSSDNTREVILEKRDKRVEYVNTGKRVSMARNWEFALSHVKDDNSWITILGDDDGLLPNTLQKVTNIIENNDCLVIRGANASFLWPDATEDGKGVLRMRHSNMSESRNSHEWLEKIIKNRCRYEDLPTIYTGGFIHSSVVRKVKAGGDFFRSMIPDIYSSLAICSASDSYYYTREILAIGGCSRHSNGSATLSATRTTQSPIAKAFFSENDIKFHPDIPLNEDGSHVKSIRALIYESLLQLREAGFWTPALPNNENILLDILADSNRKNYPAVRKWADLYCAKHNIKIDQLRGKLASKRALRKLRKLARQMTKQKDIILNESNNTPLHNIKDASMAISNFLAQHSQC